MAAVPLVLVRAILLQGLPEEILFRGYLVQTASGLLPGWGVFTLSTLLFGVRHIVSRSGATTVTQRLLFLLLPIGFGVLATVMRLMSHSVWPAVAVHGGFPFECLRRRRVGRPVTARVRRLPRRGRRYAARGSGSKGGRRTRVIIDRVHGLSADRLVAEPVVERPAVAVPRRAGVSALGRSGRSGPGARPTL